MNIQHESPEFKNDLEQQIADWVDAHRPHYKDDPLNQYWAEFRETLEEICREGFEKGEVS